METPPYAPPRRKSNTGLIIGIVVGVLVLCCILPVALIGGAGVWGFSKAKSMVECAVNIKDVRDSLIRYADDHEGKLPPAASWQDDIGPYFTKVSTENKDQRGPFKAWTVSGTWQCSTEGTGTGVALNLDLAGKDLKSVKSRFDTILLFEVSKTGRNLAEKYVKRPFSESPKMFNKPRGWVEIAVEGDSDIRTRRGRSVHINTGGTHVDVDSDKDSGPDKNSEKDSDKSSEKGSDSESGGSKE